MPFLGIYPKDSISYCRDICSSMFIAALFLTARNWKQLRCPSTDERIKCTFTQWIITLGLDTILNMTWEALPDLFSDCLTTSLRILSPLVVLSHTGFLSRMVLSWVRVSSQAIFFGTSNVTSHRPSQNALHTTTFYNNFLVYFLHSPYHNLYMLGFGEWYNIYKHMALGITVIISINPILSAETDE